jgi:G:T-mismatch repair DNA endonuclease (very short patch repair protein)
MNKKCLICRKEIADHKKYCSRDCYYESRKGVKRPEVGKKISKALKGSYYPPERGQAISKAKQPFPITEEEWNIIKKTKEEYFYVSNLDIFLQRCNLSRKFKKGQACEIVNFLNPESKRYNHHRLEIQRWDSHKMQEFIKDINTLQSFTDILKKYNLCQKGFNRLLERENFTSVFTEDLQVKMTMPERTTYNILKQMDVSFEREKYINNMEWRVDFRINNDIILEVNGDYWHGNSRIYKENNLNKVQLKNKNNDIKKYNYIIESGYRLFVIWEMDIYNNFERVKDHLLKMIQGDTNERYYDSQFI